MFKRRLNTSDYLLILVNLVPLYGVWFEGWDPRMVFLVYCLETIIIGIMTILKMAAVTLLVRNDETWKINGRNTLLIGWFLILFFILHYGIFVFVQTQLFFGVSGLMKGTSILSGYSQMPGLLGNEGKLLLAIFICYYTMETLFNFFLSGEYERISMARLMFQPYGRIMIQQVVVILGSMFLTFGAGKIFILVFVVIRILAEVYLRFDRFLNLAEKKVLAENDVSS